MKSESLTGLYAIADMSCLTDANLVEKVSLAIQGGAQLIQYRDKRQDQDLKLDNARKLAQLCQTHSALFIMNDEVEIAAEVSAHGVHLGKDDRSPIEARKILGDQVIIGVSCYDSFQNALAAERAGADYVAFGRFFDSSTKPDAISAEIDLIHHASQHLQRPICAIGGITVDNGKMLIDAGAQMLAVVNGLFAQDDVEMIARKFSHLFANRGHVGLL